MDQTESGDLHFPTFSNDTCQFRPVVGSCSYILNLPQNQKTVAKHSPEDDMLVIEPITLCTGHEKLTSISVGSAVGH